jgi:pimeloyl-ACP methyl ester carboxylesterase
LTYVFVHGGGTTARFWDRLLPWLDRPALAVDLPGRNGKPADLASITVDGEVASVLADIEALIPPTPIVLVAHSSGGLVVPGVVAALGDRVEHVVLNAALVPPEGGCGVDCLQPRHGEGLRQSVEAARGTGAVLTLPGPPADPEAMRRTYGGDLLDDDEVAYVSDPVRFVEDTLNHYFQPVHWSSAGDVAVTYVVNERDRPIPFALQDEMITRLPGTPRRVDLDGGHIPAVTAPETFAAVLRTVLGRFKGS